MEEHYRCVGGAAADEHGRRLCLPPKVRKDAGATAERSSACRQLCCGKTTGKAGATGNCGVIAASNRACAPADMSAAASRATAN